jgi:DDE superfamily endonuclease
LKDQWCIPPEQNAAFVCAMEDVLDVYERPYNPKRPVVGLDEKPFLLTRRHLTGRSRCQLIRDVLQPINPKPGQIKREDYEYERLGTANLFGWVEPLTGNRDVWVTERRTKLDYAHALKRLSEAFPDAEVIVVVQDNLNTHTRAALYEAFPAAEARALARRFEFHFTPKHGSWLNVQELEWSALARQALGERVGDVVALAGVAEQWVTDRRARAVRIDWQFRSVDAVVKLKRLYPVFTV